MTDMQADHGETTPMSDGLAAVVEDVRADIAAGRIADDVSAELRRRADAAGVAVSDEDLEQVASDLEIESSR